MAQGLASEWTSRQRPHRTRTPRQRESGCVLGRRGFPPCRRAPVSPAARPYATALVRDNRFIVGVGIVRQLLWRRTVAIVGEMLVLRWLSVEVAASLGCFAWCGGLSGITTAFVWIRGRVSVRLGFADGNAHLSFYRHRGFDLAVAADRP